jgi:hypothetical protein
MTAMLSHPSRLRRSVRSNARLRGAIFVEAVIIICTFTLLLMGAIFFRELYVKKIRTQTLARASAIAYSMSGCESNDPRQWLGKDLGNNNPSNKTDDERAVPKAGSSLGATGSDKASGILAGQKKVGDGSTFLNPVNKVVLTKPIKVSKPNGLFKSDSVLSTTVGARSHQSCGDVVRDGEFDEIVNEVTSFF